jgi:hypothetical protein
MAELGLGQPEIAWHSERDRIAEVGCFLGLVTGTLAKLASACTYGRHIHEAVAAAIGRGERVDVWTLRVHEHRRRGVARPVPDNRPLSDRFADAAPGNGTAANQDELVVHVVTRVR